MIAGLVAIVYVAAALGDAGSSTGVAVVVVVVVLTRIAVPSAVGFVAAAFDDVGASAGIAISVFARVFVFVYVCVSLCAVDDVGASAGIAIFVCARVFVFVDMCLSLCAHGRRRRRLARTGVRASTATVLGMTPAVRHRHRLKCRAGSLATRAL